MIAGFSGLMITDDAATTALMESMLAEARAEGAFAWIPYTLEILALGRLLRGEFQDAGACVAEGVSLAADLGMDVEVVVLNAIAAWLAAVSGDAPRSGGLACWAWPAAVPRPRSTGWTASATARPATTSSSAPSPTWWRRRCAAASPIARNSPWPRWTTGPGTPAARWPRPSRGAATP